MRRAATDSALDAGRWVQVHSGGSRADLEQGPPQPGSAAAAEATSGSSEQKQQSWWQRLPSLAGGGSGVQQRDLAMASAGPAPMLRRTQSAPLQHGQQAEAAHIAVPIRMRARDGEGRDNQAAATSSSGGGGEGSSSGGGGGGAGSAADDVLPYRLQAVGHSLGAATLLIYAVCCRMQGQPHRLRRLVLMSPAGFHPTIPLVSCELEIGGRCAGRPAHGMCVCPG